MLAVTLLSLKTTEAFVMLCNQLFFRRPNEKSQIIVALCWLIKWQGKLAFPATVSDLECCRVGIFT